MLVLEELASSYGEAPVLNDVTLTVSPGETVALMGRNGVGKTTLLRTVMGLVETGHGRISFADRDLCRLSPDRRARLGIGYVPQGREIFPYLTVEENLRLGLLAVGRDAATLPEGVFELFPRLEEMLPKKGGVLSGGEQQQLAIARVLVAEPRLVLLDEPTEGIQPSIVQEIEEALRRLQTTGKMSVLLVEQYLDFALRLADSFYVMEKGSIVQEGSCSEVARESIQKYLAV